MITEGWYVYGRYPSALNAPIHQEACKKVILGNLCLVDYFVKMGDTRDRIISRAIRIIQK